MRIYGMGGATEGRGLKFYIMEKKYEITGRVSE